MTTFSDTSVQMKPVSRPSQSTSSTLIPTYHFPKECHINTLPVELLSRIFCFTGNRLPSIYLYGATRGGEVLVSHVCRRWRAVAIDATTLWTTIDVLKINDEAVDRVQIYISRSKEAPLDIFIRTSTTPDLIEDLSDRTQKNVQKILDSLYPHTRRWRICHLNIWIPSLHQKLLEKLPQLAAAPNLRTLTVDGNPFSRPTKAMDALPFHGILPRLTELCFKDISFDWPARTLRHLTFLSLDLLLCSGQILPLARLKGMLSHCESLSQLYLSGTASFEIACFAPPDPDSWPNNAASLPSLTMLILESCRPDLALAIARSIDTPLLRVLDLRLTNSPGDFDPLIRHLQSIHPATGKSVMNNLEGLRVLGTSYSSEMSVISDTFSALSNLRVLCIDRVASGQWYGALFTTVSDRNQVRGRTHKLTRSKSKFLPKLTTLVIPDVLSFDISTLLAWKQHETLLLRQILVDAGRTEPYDEKGSKKAKLAVHKIGGLRFGGFHMVTLMEIDGSESSASL